MFVFKCRRRRNKTYNRLLQMDTHTLLESKRMLSNKKSGRHGRHIYETGGKVAPTSRRQYNQIRTAQSGAPQKSAIQSKRLSERDHLLKLILIQL